jgi:hypothetical protein
MEELQLPNQMADMVVAAFLASPQIRQQIGDAAFRQLGALTDKQVAQICSVSQTAIRKNEQLMSLSRYIDGIGRRWTAEDISHYIDGHPRGGRGLRRSIKATVEEIED